MSPSPPYKVLVVDDSAVVRQTMQTIMEDDPELVVIATAADPIIAARKMQREFPDVIVLDVEMPKMNGLEFLQRLMAQRPVPVVICSAFTPAGSDLAFKAMEYGAVDVVSKPAVGKQRFLEESRIRICDTVRAAACADLKRSSRTRATPPSARRATAPRPKLAPKPRRRTSPSTPPLVTPKLSADVIIPRRRAVEVPETEPVIVIGSSTGGTEALRLLLPTLPADAPGVVVVQHMPAQFTGAFARRLDELCAMHVREAANGDVVQAGTVLIAPGGLHTLLRRAGTTYRLEVRDGPLVSRHRPSVDVLFRSTARYAGSNAVAVILTGMGDDGAQGMLELFEAGAHTIAQDEASCVVFGMPQEAIRTGGVQEVVSLEEISDAILDAASG